MKETSPQSAKPSCGQGCAVIVFVAFFAWITIAKFWPTVLENVAENVGKLFRDDQEMQRQREQETKPVPIVPIIVPKKEDP
jgi:hypothetical protein